MSKPQSTKRKLKSLKKGGKTRSFHFRLTIRDAQTWEIIHSEVGKEADIAQAIATRVDPALPIEVKRSITHTTTPDGTSVTVQISQPAFL